MRFIVPAIRDPVLSGLWSGDIEPEEKKTLNSISLLIQKIANLSSNFRGDDVYAPFSKYIEESNTSFLRFIDEISTNEDHPKKGSGTIVINSLIAYDAACLVHFFNQHTDYYDKNREDHDVQFILQILKPINLAIEDSEKKKKH